MAKLIQLPATRPVNEGEALVVAYLKDHLPDTYTLIPNTEIAQPGQPPFEYDLIVVAPHAVYVVEIKRWLGGIRGDDHTWVVAGKYPRPNPWPTTNKKARVLKSVIEQRQPACYAAWVQAVVAIADDQGDLNLRGLQRDWCVRYTEFPTLLADAAALPQAADLRPLRAYIEKAIQETAGGRPAQALRFGDYKVLETLSRRDTVSEFLAQNTLLRGEEKMRLRTFTYDPYAPPDVQSRRQEIIRREAEALQKTGAHPNLIRLHAFFTDPNDPNLFVEVTEWSEAGTLRALLSAEGALSLERKLELAQGIAAGLKAAHDAEVIHRDVRPANILIGLDGRPRLMNFDHARLTLPGTRTVGPIKPDPDVPRAYMAPELLNPVQVPTPAADLYGLGMTLFEMLTGSTLYDGPEDALASSTSLGSPADYAADVPDLLNDLVRRMIHADPKRRPQSADEVLDILREIREKPSGTIAAGPQPEAVSQPAAVTADPAVFDEGDIIDGKYLVQKVLDAGGSGRVYRVYDSIFDRSYALKIFEGTALSLDFLKQEAQSLLAVSHPHIVKVHTWGRLAPSGRFYLVTDFVEGEDLNKYTTPDRRLAVGEAVDTMLDLLTALNQIHPDVERMAELRVKMESGDISQEEYEEFGELQNTGVLHRDIKPANLMLSPVNGLMLIDFNIAAKAREAGKTYVGTPGYMLPDVGLIKWDTDGDLFATGIVLYELITGHHPYPERQPNAETPPDDPCRYVQELHPAFADLLCKAASCDANVRFHSARRFRQALLDLDGIYLQALPPAPLGIELALEADEVGKANYNPYVTRFLKLYSQARRDNSGTRGLDDVANLTYVPTRLDRLLRPAVLNGQYRLVIITGNAGDGKTAFIQKLEAEVGEQAITRPTSNSSTFNHNGIRFVTNYDGSQDEGAERANDQVLNEFFAPFDDTAFDQASQERAVHIIAINEGRLIDFFGDAIRRAIGPGNGGQMPGGLQSSPGDFHFWKLGETLGQYLNDASRERALPSWLLVVDLNRRSVVAGDPDIEGKSSIFERQLQALLEPGFWEPCQACAHRERCFIHYNVMTLSDSTAGLQVRERLRTLFEIVHLRRLMHITMRDMRSALSWLLFRDHTCDDVSTLLESAAPSEKRLSLLYSNAFAADGEPPEGRRDDRLVHLLRQIDPAGVANPTMDRAIHFQGVAGLSRLAFERRSPLMSTWLEEWRLPVGWESAQQPEIAAQVQARHAMARRMAFFELRGETQDWHAMLPYQELATFRKAIQASEPEDSTDLRDLLVKSFSLAEGARNEQLAQQYLCLRAGQAEKVTTAKVVMKSFRLFPHSDFQIEVSQMRTGHYLEYMPDHFVFYYAPDTDHQIQSGSRAELVVSLDLLELLVQVHKGFRPSLDDVQGYFLNLVVFKNILTHLPYRRVILTRNDQKFYQLVLNDQMTITLQPWSAENNP